MSRYVQKLRLACRPREKNNYGQNQLVARVVSCRDSLRAGEVMVEILLDLPSTLFSGAKVKVVVEDPSDDVRAAGSVP